MTPHEFIEKWRGNPLKERASYQLHFIDLCAQIKLDRGYRRQRQEQRQRQIRQRDKAVMSVKRHRFLSLT